LHEKGRQSGILIPGRLRVRPAEVWADFYDDQPDVDRAAHKAVPVQVGLVLAGSIESVVIGVNVMV